MEGRTQAMYAIQALKSCVPGFETAKLRLVKIKRIIFESKYYDS